MLCRLRAVLAELAHALLQLLRHMPDAPQLPASYPAMMLLALVPPLFSAVMDPRALAFSGASASRGNDTGSGSSGAAATAAK